jgi:hypothetical protein
MHARLGKAEVLNNNHHRARIIHSDGWKDRVAQRLRKAA